MKRIQAKKHKLGTYEIDKISSSCFYNKRYVLDDGFILWLIFIKIVTSCKKIKKDCDNSKILQKKIHVSNKMNLSSNINEGIRAVLFFKQKDFTRTEKSTKKHKTSNR